MPRKIYWKCTTHQYNWDRPNSQAAVFQCLKLLLVLWLHDSRIVFCCIPLPFQFARAGNYQRYRYKYHCCHCKHHIYLILLPNPTDCYNQPDDKFHWRTYENCRGCMVFHLSPIIFRIFSDLFIIDLRVGSIYSSAVRSQLRSNCFFFLPFLNIWFYSEKDIEILPYHSIRSSCLIFRLDSTIYIRHVAIDHILVPI